eukprot:CAMPEP_0172933902 /NCGR_PEP_ID=MMETSP1075-20121228/220741_1 /TAXON_ID=2916 /ORGANISM="Ceratium fusus, Strain PA161109" /LENGTH=251 /DNA_ID=CAMNT_0013795249 /DNA_START=203 /DNA_END=958 /DNA_ORIENTATION=-
MAFLLNKVAPWPTEEVGMIKALVVALAVVAQTTPSYVLSNGAQSKALQEDAGSLNLEELLKFGDAHQAGATCSKPPEDSLNVVVAVRRAYKPDGPMPFITPQGISAEYSGAVTNGGGGGGTGVGGGGSGGCCASANGTSLCMYEWRSVDGIPGGRLFTESLEKSLEFNDTHQASVTRSKTSEDSFNVMVAVRRAHELDRPMPFITCQPTVAVSVEECEGIHHTSLIARCHSSRVNQPSPSRSKSVKAFTNV